MQQVLKETQRKLKIKARLIKKKGSRSRQRKLLQGASRSAKPARKSSKIEKMPNANVNYYSMHQSTTCYILDGINSIAYANDRIYNLMKFKPRSVWGKALKCKCSKSKCEAKYCECFSRNQVCGSECSCEGCNNTDQKRFQAVKVGEETGQGGCRCSKSECLKNYCQCFQKGQSCGQKCKCLNCKNSL